MKLCLLYKIIQGADHLSVLLTIELQLCFSFTTPFQYQLLHHLPNIISTYTFSYNIAIFLQFTPIVGDLPVVDGRAQ